MPRDRQLARKTMNHHRHVFLENAFDYEKQRHSCTSKQISARNSLAKMVCCFDYLTNINNTYK